jgi:UDP-N-acetylglucosamine acyltransferase
MNIHPTSLVSKEAIIDPSVVIGPHCLIRGQVKIGKNTVLENNVVLGTDHGVVEVGEENHFYTGAVIGEIPQDKKYKGEKTKLVIGNNNQIREYATLNIGTVTGGGMTFLGNNNLVMAYVHFGHDCHVGNNNVIANSCQLAGHVTIQDFVTLGGMSAVNQFATLGSYAFIGGFSAINRDILPYSIAQGNYAIVRATNKIGLERAGFSPEKISEINKAIRILSKDESNIEEKLSRIESECKPSSELSYLTDFVKKSERGIAL